MDYNKMKKIAEELLVFSQKCNIPIVSSNLTNTVDICILPCSPIIVSDFTGFKPNTIHILKNRGVKCDVKQSNR